MTSEAAVTLIAIGLLFGFGLGTAFGAWLQKPDETEPLETSAEPALRFDTDPPTLPFRKRSDS